MLFAGCRRSQSGSTCHRPEIRAHVDFNLIGIFFRISSPVCGDDRDRTRNLRLAKPALSQLSYVPATAACAASGRTWIRTKDLSFIRAAL